MSVAVTSDIPSPSRSIRRALASRRTIGATRPALLPAPSNLPPDIAALLPLLPKFVDRPDGAQLLSQNLFRVTAKALQSWPIATRIVNKRAMMATADLFALAQSKLDAAPAIMGGHKAKTDR